MSDHTDIRHGNASGYSDGRQGNRVLEPAGPIVFSLSFALLAMLYGIVASWWGWFPAPQVGLAHSTLMSVARNWKNDVGLEPTRHLVAPDDTGEPPDPQRGYASYSDAAEPGYTLVAGLNSDIDTAFHSARLYDMEGREVHRWPVHYDQLDPERPPQNVMLHGMEVFEDGSIAVTFDAGNAIARLDACGGTLWKVNGSFHHSITRDGAGSLLTWRGEEVVWLDEDTGEEVASLDLAKDIIAGGDGEQRGYLDIRTRTPEEPWEEVVYLEDPFHPNDVEALRADMADAFPMFEAGDLLLSLRELNMIAVVDPQDGTMKWWRQGPWIKQHDPDFQPDGTITVFDNATGTGQSRIRRIDPSDNRLSVVFSGTDEQPFYSWRRGKHQILPNGNLLLTEAEHGRVLEVARDGSIVWELEMPWDDDSNLIVTEARHVPPDFFADGLPSCGRRQM